MFPKSRVVLLAFVLFLSGFLSRTTFAETVTAVATNTAIVPIPIEDVSMEAVATVDGLREIDTDLEDDPLTADIKKRWPDFSKQINAQLEDAARLLKSHPSLESLRRSGRSLVRMTHTLDNWNQNLTRRANQLDKKLDQLSRSASTWKITGEAADSDPEVPAQVRENIQTSLDSVMDARDELSDVKRATLSLQNRVAQADRRLDSSIDSIKQMESRILDRVLDQDSPPLWNLSLSTTEATDTVSQSAESVSNQKKSVVSFVKDQKAQVLGHLAVILIAPFIALWLRRRLAHRLAHFGMMQSATGIFNSPISISLFVALMAGHFLYGTAPRAWSALISTAAILPAGFAIRRLVGRHYVPVPLVLLAYFLFDQVRSAFMWSPLVFRWTLAVEHLTAALFALHFARQIVRRFRGRHLKPRQHALVWGVNIAFVLLTVATIGNIAGFFTLASLFGNAVLQSAYAAVLLYATVRVLAVITMFLLRTRPIDLLHSVRRHRFIIWRRAVYFFQLAGFVLWILFTLDRMALFEPFSEWLTAMLIRPIGIGSIQLTLGHGLVFVATLWFAYHLSRFIRFLLEEDVYAHLHLAPGLPYAISMSIHYTILVVGFLTAAAALGFDMTKITILVSAFGVGLGFGLQNILNNFVSGLILLFERPVKVGDVIQMDDATGVIVRIGIRATIIRTAAGSQVILPNGKFISDRVINWTFGNKLRVVDVTIAVASSSDPSHVADVLKRVAERDERVSKDPKPEVIVTKMSAASIEMQLRAFTAHVEDVSVLKGDLTVAAYRALNQEKIQQI